MVTRLVYSPTFFALKFKTDLIDNLSSYVEKIKDAHVDELNATQSATVSNRLVIACFELIFKET